MHVRMSWMADISFQVTLLPRQGVQRVTRIMLRDLLACMEQDHFLRCSLTLYRAMLWLCVAAGIEWNETQCKSVLRPRVLDFFFALFFSSVCEFISTTVLKKMLKKQYWRFICVLFQKKKKKSITKHCCCLLPIVVNAVLFEFAPTKNLGFVTAICLQVFVASILSGSCSSFITKKNDFDHSELCGY